MSNEATTHHHDLRCVAGVHNWVQIRNETPGAESAGMVECTRCGRRRDPHSYQPPRNTGYDYTGC